MKNLFSIILLVSIFLGSCYYDSEEDLYPTTSCTTDNMSFSNDVNKILDFNGCLSCHSAAAAQGNVDLSNHDQVLKYVNNGSLLGSIQHASGYKAMPQGSAKMGSCAISKIEAWIAQGSLNN